jgi:hypothetical protein
MRDGSAQPTLGPQSTEGENVLKRIFIVAALFAALATGLWAVLAEAAPEGSITVLAKLEPRSLASVNGGQKGHSPGETIVFSTALSENGKPAGRGEFVQTVVDPRFGGVSFRADLLLPSGTIELQGSGLSKRPPGGAMPKTETAMAVVGGTGTYAGASGTAHLIPAGKTTQRLEIDFAH